MRQQAYILLMLKHLSARGSLFLFVRTHRQLEYYFNLSDTREAANQSVAVTRVAPPQGANVVKFRAIPAPAVSQRQ